ncbi:hypothetical protein GIB67_024508, partial [Kingdonia uniflora]
QIHGVWALKTSCFSNYSGSPSPHSSQLYLLYHQHHISTSFILSFLQTTMASLTLLLFASLLLQPHTSFSLTTTCSSQKFSKNRFFANCTDLTKLNSYLHWSYDSSKSSLSIAFIATPSKPSGWIAWAINPFSTGMLGSQALIAYRQGNGSMTVGTFNVSNYKGVEPGKIAFEVPEMEAEYVDGVMRIYATVVLTKAVGTVVNQVWQVGDGVTGGIPNIHGFTPDNLNSKATLDLVKGESNNNGGGGGGDSRLRKKNIHGVLNAVSWGIMFPLGVIIARYMRTFKSADPAWFYLHAFCQFSAYVIGVAGWATGLKLGSQSVGIVYKNHKNIGIALFCFATLQIFALLIRPKKEHKFRIFWNIYHHSVGYSIIVLGIINVFKGLDILKPEEKYKTAYEIVLIVLGGVALLLEAITWIVVLRRKSNKATLPYNGNDRE